MTHQLRLHDDNEEILITRKRAISGPTADTLAADTVEVVIHYSTNDDADDLFNTRMTEEGNIDGVESGGSTDTPSVDGSDMVEVVARAVSTDLGVGMTITHGDLEGEFLVDVDNDEDADLVYSYDSDDIFIDSHRRRGCRDHHGQVHNQDRRWWQHHRGSGL